MFRRWLRMRVISSKRTRMYWPRRGTSRPSSFSTARAKAGCWHIGETDAWLLSIGRDVIEAIEIGDRLQVGLVFDQLLGAAMEQADMGIQPLHHFAIHLHDQAKHAVGGRMLRPEIHRHRLDLEFGHQGFFSAFSSPGSERTMPSHGLTKSKV